MVGMKKAATDAICGGFTPPLLQTTRGAAVQSTETQTEIEQLLAQAVTAKDRNVMGYHQLDDFTRRLGDACYAALAAERDRADRAEARLGDVWDEAVRSANLVETSARLSIEHDANPYRSEATA